MEDLVASLSLGVCGFISKCAKTTPPSAKDLGASSNLGKRVFVSKLAAACPPAEDIGATVIEQEHEKRQLPFIGLAN